MNTYMQSGHLAKRIGANDEKDLPPPGPPRQWQAKTKRHPMMAGTSTNCEHRSQREAISPHLLPQELTQNECTTTIHAQAQQAIEHDKK
jgi:hypothetical protein